jgi:hypothetical protein
LGQLDDPGTSHLGVMDMVTGLTHYLMRFLALPWNIIPT